MRQTLKISDMSTCSVRLCFMDSTSTCNGFPPCVYNIYLHITQSTHRKMKIEWASSFRSDGSRRRPPPSTMHGWLAKMRGTLLGNEELRSKGMTEMREAQAARKRRKGSHPASSGRSVFSIFSFYMGPLKKPVRHPTNSARPTYRTQERHQSYRSHRSRTSVKPSHKSSNPSRGSSGRTHRRKPSSRSYSSGSRK